MYLDDIKLNMNIDIPPVVIDKEQMMEFSQTYNPIPIHCDEEDAKNTKFGRVLASGYMSFMAVWAKFMENDIFGDELIAGKSSKIEWFRPVFAQDILTGRVTVTNITRRNVYNGIAEITIDVYNQDNELVLTNVTESVVKYKT
ncbi:MAG: MaoC family dehydratase N-terminal domain-containing protein [Oscillospiraceae bacterium]|nr:MaoC family dehydratase N-terminal domain-containing protein [Oscillospiraceae bacterium]